MFTTINTCWEATQRVMAAKITRVTHKIAIQLNLMAESCTICSSRSRWPVQKLLDTASYRSMSNRRTNSYINFTNAITYTTVGKQC
jgi:hypothetical protein